MYFDDRIDAARRDRGRARGENARIAARLREASDLLRARPASRHAAQAYRHAAEAVAHEPRLLRRIFEQDGLKGLDAIPGVGPGIASAIAEMLTTRRWHEIERLRGAPSPAAAPPRPPAERIIDLDREFRLVPLVAPGERR